MLLDEVGSGTDPIEGGALGVAIVDHFRQRGATLIATSHYDALKTYASTTDGVASAAFGFDAETFAPTYQLDLRLARPQPRARDRGPAGPESGRRRHARANLSAREAQLAEHLAKIDRDMRALEHEQRLAAREREELEAAAGRMRQREDALRQREETFRRRLNEELETQVRQARREIDDGDRRAEGKDGGHRRKKSRRRRAPRRDDRRHGRGARRRARGRGQRRRAAAGTGDAAHDPEAGPPSPATRAATDAMPRVGDRVIVGGFGLEGVVTGIHDGAAEIDVRGKRMRASVRDLRVVDGARARRAGARQGERRAAAARDDAVGPERDRVHGGRGDRRVPSGFSTNRC